MLFRNKKMRARTRKRNFRQFVRPVLIGLAFVMTMSVALSMYFQQEDKFVELEKRNAELLEEKQAAESKQEEIRDLLENWNTPEYIEKIARDEFGLVKPGEILFVE
ncbi:septum formation initiator family protein [Candidatus Nomurabacteria bacterium]|jgi:cell division protein DivIC|nr:septum formation initiator family protein [Eubacteriales bacterium]NCU26226.1 septum formation initiator family protein [Candidatus Nomurabacteria bacterium]